MKGRFPFFGTLLILAMCGVLLHAAEVLTQQDVIKLLELKIPEQTIIEKVKSSGTAFVLGTDDIARLKKAGASDALIAAMQSSSTVPVTGTPASEITDLALIIDYSGSMNAKMKDGVAKVASAKKCVTDLIDKLPSDLNVALIVYGTSKKRGCQDIDIVQPLGPIDKAGLTTKVNGFNATGMTPIASSLTKAGEELRKAKGGSAIVLVTDGAESCHGDPAGVAAKLGAEFGVKFGINVIGFGIEPKEKAQLADIAAKGHGQLLTVENANELAGALQKVVAEKVAPAPKQRETKQYEAAGAAIKAGAFFGDAPATQPGDYKGALAMKEAKYYQVMLQKGQELRAIGIIQKTPYEGAGHISLQTFAVTVYNKDFARVAHEERDVEGSPTEPATIRAVWTADVSGPAYVAISASDNHEKGGRPVEPYKPKEPQPSPYTLKIKVEGEKREAREPSSSIVRVETTGGAGFNAAAELELPTLVTSDLKLGETAFFKFQVRKGAVVNASAAFQKPWYDANGHTIKATYTLTFYDDDQVQVAQNKVDVAMNPPEAQTLTLTWPATLSGNAYLSVGALNSGEHIYPASFQPNPGRFSVQLTTEEGSPPSHLEGEQPIKLETPAGVEKSAETPQPAETKASSNPFAGAEATSSSTP